MIEFVPVSHLVRFVGEPFETGEVDEDFFERLCEMVQDPPQFIAAVAGGIKTCPRCRFTGGNVIPYRRIGPGVRIGQPLKVDARSPGVLWVPGEGFLWVCARSMTHAIDSHEYRPPEEFCKAVMRCPPIRSMDYLKAILNNGGRELRFGSSIR